MAIDRDGDGPPLRRAQTSADDSNTLRATPFTEDVFDDDYYRGRGRSSGSPLGLVIGVLVGAALAGGAAWFVLKDRGVGSLPKTSGGVPVVKADPSPYKIKPENPGGMQVENQDKTVYDRVSKADAPTRVENLLPPPEKPKPPKKVETKPAEPKPEVKSPLEAKRDELAAMIESLEKKNEAQEKSTAEAKAAFGDAPKPAETKPADAKQAEVKAPTPLVPNTASPAPAAAEPTPKLEFPPPRMPGGEPMPPAPPAQTAPAPSGTGVQIQLAAAKTEEAAMAEWNRMKAKHPDLLGALSPTVLRADLGERGVFFRLRAGSLPDKAAADALCASLTAQGDACLVVKP